MIIFVTKRQIFLFSCFLLIKEVIVSTDIQIFDVNIKKIGTTSDNRQLYSLPDPDLNRVIKFSVGENDKDTFEKYISTLNETGKESFDAENINKNINKAFAILAGFSAAGVAIPSYLTRNSKNMTKALSIGAGIALGVGAGILGCIKCLTPKLYQEAKIAKEKIKALDIRREK